MGKRSRVGALVVCAMSVGLWGQQAVAPPPRPGDGGPGLAETMKFVEDKMNEVGEVSYIESYHDTTSGADGQNQFMAYWTAVRLKPADCSFSYHEKDKRDAEAETDMDFGFALRDVESVSVMPLEQITNVWNAAAGAPNLVATSSNPPVTALLIQQVHGKVDWFPFFDAQLADRLAKAVTHAVELCGGGNKDPF